MRTVRVSREIWILAAICVTDMALTLALVVTGKAAEANPVLRFYMDISLGWFVAAKSLLIIGPLFVLEMLRSHRPRFVKRALRAGIVLYLLCYGIGLYQVNSRTAAKAAQIVSADHGD